MWTASWTSQDFKLADDKELKALKGLKESKVTLSGSQRDSFASLSIFIRELLTCLKQMFVN